MNRPSLLESAFTEEFQQMFMRWATTQAPRQGLRASTVLASDDEWCPREGVLRIVTPASKWDTEAHDWYTNAIFLNGWRLHQKWQALFKDTGLAVWNAEQQAHELDLTHYDKLYNLYYSPDAIIEYLDRKFVVEIKGITTRDFQLVKDADLAHAATVNKSIRGAIPQLNLYMALTGIHNGLVLVEDKNNQQFRVWTLAFDAVLAQQYIKRIKRTRDAAQYHEIDGNLPDRHPACTSASDPRAVRCLLRSVCFREEIQVQVVQPEEIREEP